MWQQIRHLSRHNEVTVASLYHPSESAEHFSQLGRNCRLFTVPVDAAGYRFNPALPATVNQYVVPEMRRLLALLAREQFDAVFFEHIYTAPYRDLFGAEAILTEHNIESQVLHRIALLARDEEMNNEAWRLARYEDEVWPSFDLRVTVSVLDREILGDRCGTGRTVVAGNGVDCGFMAFQPERGRKTLLFMGNLQYFPNIEAIRWFRRHIIRLIWAGDPEMRLVVAGAAPGAEVLGLADDPRVEIIASPADMRSIAARASIAIVPMRVGGGTRIKILEAMALGLPVVSTALGVEGLDLEARRHVMIAEDEQAFARHCLELEGNPAMADRMRHEARGEVERHYGWDSIFATLAGTLADHAAMERGGRS